MYILLYTGKQGNSADELGEICKLCEQFPANT